MSAESLQRAITAIQEDADLKARLSRAKSVQEATDILAAAGYQIEPGDFQEAVKDYMPDLSDEELEGVAAGTTPTSLLVISIVVK